MNKKNKQPKETDAVRELLDAFTRLRRRIDNTEKRRDSLEITMGAPSTSNYSGMSGGSRDGSSKAERDIIKKEELEEKLRDLYAEENRRREEIEALIDRMDDPDEQTVMEMHYLDGARWRTVSVALYGEEPDYDDNEQRYLKRTFRLHGSALLSMARAYGRKE